MACEGGAICRWPAHGFCSDPAINLGEGLSEARPVGDRIFMARHELDGELRVPRGAQRVDTAHDFRPVAVNEVLRMRSAVKKGLSSDFTNIRRPRWFWRYGASAGWKLGAKAT